MARQITLNDREWIEIVNSNKQVTGGFWWNPSDLDIVKRCEIAIEKLQKFELPKENGMDGIFAASDEMKKIFDDLLNSDASSELFKNCNPLSPCADGSLWCEYVMDVIVKFIESELDVRIKKANAKTRKYTEKYHK